MFDKPTKILVTGATGMLGRSVFRLLKVLYPQHHLITSSRSSFNESQEHIVLDMLNIEDLKDCLEHINPEIVIHCAAFVNLTYCEKHEKETEVLHVEVPRVLSQHSSVNKMVYISTDSVFDGQVGDYKETDPVNPLNFYASSKYRGEIQVLKYARFPLVIRTNLLGYHIPFSNSLFEWGYRELKEGNNIRGYDNVFFNPLNTSKAASAILQVLEKASDSGIYHIGSEPPMSKYRFLVLLAKNNGFDTDQIQAVNLDNSASEVKRPLNTSLNTSKVRNLGIESPASTEVVSGLIDDFIKENADE
ncbi:MAG: dTDP-4-dehydrorhamnose reductase family protein [Owenweeksia sp.]